MRAYELNIPVTQQEFNANVRSIIHSVVSCAIVQSPAKITFNYVFCYESKH